MGARHIVVRRWPRALAVPIVLVSGLATTGCDPADAAIPDGGLVARLSPDGMSIELLLVTCGPDSALQALEVREARDPEADGLGELIATISPGAPDRSLPLQVPLDRETFSAAGSDVAQAEPVDRIVALEPTFTWSCCESAVGGGELL